MGNAIESSIEAAVTALIEQMLIWLEGNRRDKEINDIEKDIEKDA